MDRLYAAAQMRRAMQLFAQTIEDESVMMELADIYPQWDSESKSYSIGDKIGYGKNADGETQLYQCLQAHASQSDWSPASAASLWKAIGFSEKGIPIWTQPLGSTDAYQKGDVVMHAEKQWKSTANNNVWEPGVYGWEVVS